MSLGGDLRKVCRMRRGNLKALPEFLKVLLPDSEWDLFCSETGNEAERALVLARVVREAAWTYRASMGVVMPVAMAKGLERAFNSRADGFWHAAVTIGDGRWERKASRERGGDEGSDDSLISHLRVPPEVCFEREEARHLA